MQIHQSQLALRRSLALIGGFVVPGRCLFIVTRHPDTRLIHHTQVVLGRCVMLRGGTLIPEQGLRGIPLGATTGNIQGA